MTLGSSPRPAAPLSVSYADTGGELDRLAFAVNLAVRYHMFQCQSGKPDKEME
ncbi:hypothetical protein LH19_26425 (plasmid) [Sphingopyxis macrogoltabida]|nr:hypothetical protein LH19_26425 [Sphingopyxis macrogoltabida]